MSRWEKLPDYAAGAGWALLIFTFFCCLCFGVIKTCERIEQRKDTTAEAPREK